MQKVMIGGNGHLPDHVKINDIVYLGAHNCAMSKAYGWLYVQQNVSITDQFYKYGARHFKVPIHWYKEDNKQPEIVLAHEGDGGSNCQVTYVQRAFCRPESAKDRLQEFAKLVLENRREIVILKLESKLTENTQKNGTHGWSTTQSGQAIDQLLKYLELESRAIIWQNNCAPTLGQCRQNDKNLIIFIEPKKQIEGGLEHYTMHSYTQCAQVDWETDPMKNVQCGDFRRGSKCNDTGKIWSPFLEIHYNPENSFRPDFEYRNKYNEYNHLLDRFKQYQLHCQKKPNVLSADFIDQGDCAKVVDLLNNELIE